MTARPQKSECRSDSAAVVSLGVALCLFLCAARDIDAAGPVIQFRTVDHPAARRGRLESLSPKQAKLTIEDGTEVIEPRDSFVSFLPSADLPIPPIPDPPATPAATSPTDRDRGDRDVTATDHWLLFSNGDRWRVAGFDIIDSELLVRRASTVATSTHPGASVSPASSDDDRRGESTTTVPFDMLRGILLPTIPPVAIGKIERLVNRTQAPIDRLFLMNGDELTGELGESTVQSLGIETTVGPVAVERSKVSAVTFNVELLTPAQPVPQLAYLLLNDGSSLTATELRAQTDRPETLDVVTETGMNLSLDWSQIRRIDFASIDVQPVDRLTPSSVQGATFLGEPVQLSRGRNARDLLLQVGGEVIPQGLGVVSRTELNYDLDGTWREFETTVGLDDAAQGGGSVEFIILADNRELFRVTRKGLDGPISTGRLRLEGCRRLTLLVDFADRADIQDLANWCRPTLLR